MRGAESGKKYQCDVVPDFDLLPCCSGHDLFYRHDYDVSRLEADWILMLCVFDTGEFHLKSRRARGLLYYPYGLVMFLGVRAFGWLFYDPK